MQLSLILLFVCVAAGNAASTFEDKLKTYINAFKNNQYAIFPGTNWCGRGDIAKGNELGRLFVTDACCRAHDQCNPKMRAYSTRENLINWWPFTRLGCDCDKVFYDCLKTAETSEIEAKAVGIIYFDVFKAKCFKHQPRNVCVKWTWWLKCTKYENRQKLAFVDTWKYE